MQQSDDAFFHSVVFTLLLNGKLDISSSKETGLVPQINIVGSERGANDMAFQDQQNGSLHDCSPLMLISSMDKNLRS